MFYKVGFFVLIAIAIFIAGMQGAKLLQTPAPTPSPAPTIEQPVSSPTFTATPTQTTVSDVESIRAALAAKYSKRPSETNLTISKQTDVHAWGSFKFEGDIAGAWFLAYKKPTGWIVVDDGNGTISCEKIEPYDFPVTLVESCVNANGKLINR